jgi:Flp pilus assembly protein TadD
MLPGHPADTPPDFKPRFLRKPSFAVPVIATAALLAYLNSFSVPFVFDDEPSILSNPTIHSLARAWWPPADNGGLTVAGRPLLNFTLGLNYAVSGTGVWSYHALNLLIHVLAGLVLFGLVRRTLLRPALAPRFGAHAPELALVTALLWTLHPLQTEAVTYTIQRAESLMGLLYLLTLYCSVRSMESLRAGSWQLLAVGACALGMACKEVMVSAPLIVLLYDRTFVTGNFRAAWRQRPRLYLGLAATWIVLGGLLASTGGNRNGSIGFGTGVSWWAHALTQFQAVAHYLWLSFWPHPLVLDYSPVWVTGAGQVLPSALLVISLVMATLWGLWQSSPLGFLGMVFFSILAPTSLMPASIQLVVEHRMYLPLAVVLIPAVLAVYRWTGRYSIDAFLLLALALGLLTARRNEDYATTIRIFEDTVAKQPRNARAMALLADYYRRAGRLEDARLQLEHSLQVNPGVPEVLNNLGYIWQNLDDPGKAALCFEAALMHRPGDARTMNNLGDALILSGHVPEGIAQLEAALQAAPDLRQTRLNLANTLAQSGRASEAAVQFEILLSSSPADAGMRDDYSGVLLALGREADAIAQLEEALRLMPNDPDLHTHLGIALERTGRLYEALEQFQEALRLNPADESARQNAASTKRMLGDT